MADRKAIEHRRCSAHTRRVSDVVIIGAGICGLGTALLLARDGHDVTVLEKDPAGPPSAIGTCWDRWERKGVAQFRQPHNFMPGMRILMEAELPDVQQAIVDAGAVRFDMLDPMPPWLADWPAEPIDDELWTHAIRRPAGEAVFAQCAAREPRIRIRHGVSVAGLTTGSSATGGIPHVNGVQTSEGEEIAADLVIDASGRGSRAPAWLRAIGAHLPEDQKAGGYFTYLTRYFAGAEPKRIAPILTELGSISLLTLPGEQGTWSITIFVSSTDPIGRALHGEEAFMRVIRACPLHAHWVDATPVSDVLAMGGVTDRYRRLAIGKHPVATGFVAVADAWACTNPSAGRGMTVGMLHARLLRDMMRAHPDDPLALAQSMNEATERELKPWYDAQIAADRVRFDLMDASRTGRPPERFDDPLTRDLQLLRIGMMGDGELFRMGLEYISTLATAQDIMAREGVRERMAATADAFMKSPPPPIPGPDRQQLERLVAG